MSRKPFPIRLDTTVIEKIDMLSKSLGIPKSQIIDEALDLHLAKLNGYAAMDAGPPKTAAAVKRQVANLKGVALTMPAGIVQSGEPLQPRTHHKPVGMGGGVKRVRGWDAEGRPVY